MAKLPAGSQVFGEDFPPARYDQDWTTIANITTTSYTSGTTGVPKVAVNVTAPTSGKLLVCIGGGLRNNAATNERVVLTYRVLEDSANGPVYTAESAYRGLISCGIQASQEYTYLGTFSLETGLTPGKNYYIETRYRCINGAGTADIASRDLLVIPVP